MMGVLNEGIGGNRLLLDGRAECAGEVRSRLLAQTAVHAVIVLEGVDHLGGLTRKNEVSRRSIRRWWTGLKARTPR